MQLEYGLVRAIPDGVSAAWGARLIEPDDLVRDRTDLQGRDDASRGSLAVWLDGGAITAARRVLREQPLLQDWTVYVVFEDEHGMIAASTNRSHGYVYVAGWLKDRS